MKEGWKSERHRDKDGDCRFSCSIPEKQRNENSNQVPIRRPGKRQMRISAGGAGSYLGKTMWYRFSFRQSETRLMPRISAAFDLFCPVWASTHSMYFRS